MLYIFTAPAEQSPPVLLPTSATTVFLSWSPPEAPNGVITSFRLYRSDSNFANTSGMVFNYTDTNLSPYTLYLYSVEAVNIIGSTRSAELSVRTQEAAPESISAPSLMTINSTSVRGTWEAPGQLNGDITNYQLAISAINSVPLSTPNVVFTGLNFEAIAIGLLPYTNYTFIVIACTNAGCGSGVPATVQTLQDAPQSQAPPSIVAINATALRVTWLLPEQPNGVLTMFTIFQRVSPFLDNGEQFMSVPGNVVSVVVAGLIPFTEYEFSVAAHTVSGSAQSEWSRGRTLESGKS